MQSAFVAPPPHGCASVLTTLGRQAEVSSSRGFGSHKATDIKTHEDILQQEKKTIYQNIYESRVNVCVYNMWFVEDKTLYTEAKEKKLNEL